MRSNGPNYVGEGLRHEMAGLLDQHEQSPNEGNNLRLLEARDDERRQIARDLHDVTAQLLLELEFALNTLESEDETSKNRARVCAHEAISRLQAQVRCVSYLLHPPELSRFGLEKTLETLALGMSERCGIRIRFRSRGYRPGIPSETEMGMLRIAQEALMNIFKHSQSERAEMHLHCSRNWLCMRIRDFGIGQKARSAIEAGKGVGLSSMKERMAALGGALNVRMLEGGTVVTAVARYPLMEAHRIFGPSVDQSMIVRVQ